ncbi:MAG: sigma-54-dependent Fis family transcriptional regulator [Neisseriaceae bacterium]|nr:sigma-54-dependent Fis family transcriptional regulator [Neisseriaceae bacterium]
MSEAKQKIPIPQSQDLIDEIRFDEENGKIWLAENRMLLLSANVMAQFQTSLISALGRERSKYFLMRFGFQIGLQDAELSKKIRPNLATAEQVFLAGPQIHAIRGMVKVVPKALRIDVAKGEFYGQFDWYESYEVSNYLNQYGPSQDPVCWTLLGYASGFSSGFMGKTIVYKEVQCTAMGHRHCAIVGKPEAEWDELTDMESAMLSESIPKNLFALRTDFIHLPSSLAPSGKSKASLTIGQSQPYLDVCALVEKASRTEVSVLLTGPIGVGKGVFAYALHQQSRRAAEPFISVNCACLPPDLVEAELFGIEKGAMLGVIETRIGKIAQAEGGTVYISEVLALSLRAQARLLKLLEEKKLERLGQGYAEDIDVRVVVSCKEDLAQAVKEGRFRADLYYRLNVLPISMPALVERKEDILLLANHFVTKYAQIHRKQVLGFSDRANELMLQYEWPGNIRELEQSVERGFIMTEARQHITASHIFPNHQDQATYVNGFDQQGKLVTASGKLPEHQHHLIKQLMQHSLNLEDLEQSLITIALKEANHNISEAARRLGLTRPALAYRMKKFAV